MTLYLLLFVHIPTLTYLHLFYIMIIINIILYISNKKKPPELLRSGGFFARTRKHRQASYWILKQKPAFCQADFCKHGTLPSTAEYPFWQAVQDLLQLDRLCPPYHPSIPLASKTCFF